LGPIDEFEDSDGNNAQDEDGKDQPLKDIFWEAIDRTNDGSEQPFV
jgi:hypothetical protein